MSRLLSGRGQPGAFTHEPGEVLCGLWLAEVISLELVAPVTRS